MPASSSLYIFQYTYVLGDLSRVGISYHPLLCANVCKGQLRLAKMTLTTRVRTPLIFAVGGPFLPMPSTSVLVASPGQLEVGVLLLLPGHGASLGRGHRGGQEAAQAMKDQLQGELDKVFQQCRA